jgi:rubrerythrin
MVRKSYIVERPLMTARRGMSGKSVDPALILRNAVTMEVQGKEFYERAANKMTNQRGKDMFHSLVKQERVHIDILEDQLNRFVHDKVWLSLKQLRSEASTPNVSVFEDKDIKKIEVGPNAGELDVIKLGMEIEKKSVEYYRKAGNDIPDKNAKDTFNWLVAQEAGHLTILQAEYDYRTKSGFYMGNPEFSLEVM